MGLGLGSGLDFEEHEVSAGPDHLMTVRHVRMAGDMQAQGARLAQMWRERHAPANAIPPSYVPLATHAQREWMQLNWPACYARMQSAAESFNVDINDNRYDFSELSYGTVSAGCSCVFYPPASTAVGHGILARNYDFTIGSFANFLRRPNPPAKPAGGAALYGRPLSVRDLP